MTHLFMDRANVNMLFPDVLKFTDIMGSKKMNEVLAHATREIGEVSADYIPLKVVATFRSKRSNRALVIHGKETSLGVECDAMGLPKVNPDAPACSMYDLIFTCGYLCKQFEKEIKYDFHFDKSIPCNFGIFRAENSLDFIMNIIMEDADLDLQKPLKYQGYTITSESIKDLPSFTNMNNWSKIIIPSFILVK